MFASSSTISILGGEISNTPYLEAEDAAEEADGALAGVLLGHVHDVLLVAVLRLQDVVIAAQQQLSQPLRVP